MSVNFWSVVAVAALLLPFTSCDWDEFAVEVFDTNVKLSEKYIVRVPEFDCSPGYRRVSGRCRRLVDSYRLRVVCPRGKLYIEGKGCIKTFG